MLRRLDLADGAGGDQPFLPGRFEDPQQQRAAGHYPAVAESALKFVLPAEHDGWGDAAELAAAEVGPQVAP
jgi:hypothetical protein